MNERANVTTNQLEFCSFQGKQHCLFQALEGIFGGLQLDAIYDDWAANFNACSSSLEADFAYCDKEVYSLPEATPKPVATAYTSSKLIGIDLPTLITPNCGGGNGCVVILGQDPLRKNSDFRYRSRDVVVGTPWALHSARARQGGKGLSGVTRMWNIVQGAARKGYSVYLTDITKIWIQNPSVPGEKLTFPARDPRFIKLLQREVACIQPTKILALGKAAQQACEALKLPPTISVLNFPHPSARNDAWNAKLGNEPKTHANKVARIIGAL